MTQGEHTTKSQTFGFESTFVLTICCIHLHIDMHMLLHVIIIPWPSPRFCFLFLFNYIIRLKSILSLVRLNVLLLYVIVKDQKSHLSPGQEEGKARKLWLCWLVEFEFYSRLPRAEEKASQAQENQAESSTWFFFLLRFRKELRSEIYQYVFELAHSTKSTCLEVSFEIKDEFCLLCSS